jgi:hypothetical protein
MNESNSLQIADKSAENTARTVNLDSHGSADEIVGTIGEICGKSAAQPDAKFAQAEHKL